MSLRETAASDARRLNQSDWGQQVRLSDSDGVIYDTDNVSGDPLKAVQILYDYKTSTPTTGSEIKIPVPIVVLAKESISRVPKNGEQWAVEIPIRPISGAPKKWFTVSEARSVEGGGSVDIIRLYLHDTKDDGA